MGIAPRKGFRSILARRTTMYDPLLEVRDDTVAVAVTATARDTAVNSNADVNANANTVTTACASPELLERVRSSADSKTFRHGGGGSNNISITNTKRVNIGGSCINNNSINVNSINNVNENTNNTSTTTTTTSTTTTTAVEDAYHYADTLLETSYIYVDNALDTTQKAATELLDTSTCLGREMMMSTAASSCASLTTVGPVLHPFLETASDAVENVVAEIQEFVEYHQVLLEKHLYDCSGQQQNNNINAMNNAMNNNIDGPITNISIEVQMRSTE